MLKLFKATMIYRFTEAAPAYTAMRCDVFFRKFIVIEVLNKVAC